MGGIGSPPTEGVATAVAIARGRLPPIVVG
jgi:hypothetical protein